MILLTGTLLAHGRRTVAAALRGSGNEMATNWSSLHQVLLLKFSLSLPSQSRSYSVSGGPVTSIPYLAAMAIAAGRSSSGAK